MKFNTKKIYACETLSVKFNSISGYRVKLVGFVDHGWSYFSLNIQRIAITKLAIYNSHLGLLYHDTTKQTHLFEDKVKKKLDFS